MRPKRNQPRNSGPLSACAASSRASVSGLLSTGWQLHITCPAGCATPPAEWKLRLKAIKQHSGKFLEELVAQAPPMAHIEDIQTKFSSPQGYTDFRIQESVSKANQYQLVSPDIATCDECREEIFDPSNRRYRYPFHQLHQLRPPLHDYRRYSLRPSQHDDAGFQNVPPLPAENTMTR